MGNTILFNTAGAIALAVNYEIQGPYSNKFLTKQGDTTIRINAEVFIRVDDAILSIDTDVDLTEADLDSGEAFANSTTYYIYACHPASGATPDFVISENGTYPSGYTALTSRKIGGFDTDGSGHVTESTLWDLRTADILTNAIASYNDAGLSGTPKVAEIDLGGVPHYFKVYPTKA